MIVIGFTAGVVERTEDSAAFVTFVALTSFAHLSNRCLNISEEGHAVSVDLDALHIPPARIGDRLGGRGNACVAKRRSWRCSQN